IEQHLRKPKSSRINLRHHVAAFNGQIRLPSESSYFKTASALACSGQAELHWDVLGLSLALLESGRLKSPDMAPSYHHIERWLLTPVSTSAPQAFAGVRLRRRRRRQKIPANWRRSVNGHAHSGAELVLRPDAGQSVQVLADIGDRVHQAYCIAVLTSDGWEFDSVASDCPLRVRLSLGLRRVPVGKLLVREAGRPLPGQHPAAGQPAHPMLHHLLDSLTRRRRRRSPHQSLL
uniref:Transposase n=1 Tax=Macrostomum lignano TaxID=282301 RepID=A0A1I8JML3_9PLAT